MTSEMDRSDSGDPYHRLASERLGAPDGDRRRLLAFPDRQPRRPCGIRRAASIPVAVRFDLDAIPAERQPSQHAPGSRGLFRPVRKLGIGDGMK